MKLFYTLVAACLISGAAYAQSPELINYQAVVRDATQQVVSNGSVGMQISILQGSPVGTAVYVETHSLTSNANGVVAMQIGGGTLVSGNFSTIDWSAGPYFIQTEVDPMGGTNYTVSGTSQLVSVPYALHAETASHAINDAVDDADNDPTNEIETWSTLAGIPADIADGDNVDDADNDPTNEIETWSTLAGIPADIADGDNVDDADNDPTNEIETWSTLAGIPADIADGDDVNDADNDPTNEIETWSTLAGIPADIADGDNVDDADNDPTNEIETWSTLAGIPADIADGDNVDDADNDPTNEIETWSTLAGIPADIADGDNVDDADNDPTNEIETWSTLAGIPADIADGDDVNDADSDPTNELQALSLSGANLTISGGNSVDLSGISSGDKDWIVANTTNTVPTTNNQNIYTNGNVGIGESNPASKVEVVGDVRLTGNNAGVIYENKETNKDWRLVYSDKFEANVEGWIANQSLTAGDLGMTRQNSNVAGLVGHFIRPNDNNHTLKKYFDLSGMSYSEVKIEFNYLFLDSWDNETGWLAVKGSETGNPTPIWIRKHEHNEADLELNGTKYNVSFFGNGSFSDTKQAGQAQFSWGGGGFWIEFGANLDDAISDETFGIDNIVVYVR